LTVRGGNTIVMLRLLTVLGGVLALGKGRPNYKEAEWDYGTDKGPSMWEDDYPNCGGFSQSPVALPGTWENSTFLRRFGWYEFGHNRTYTIENDGRRLILGYKPDDLPAPYFKGALFDPKVRFQFHKMILHWGSDSTRGSEHSIAGWQYPGEMQFIGWDTKYGSYEEASTVPGGIAIAVFLLQLSKEDNTNFDWFLSNVWKINGKNEQVELGVGNLHWVFPVDASSSHDCEFYLYEGSSSYPPCNEVAVWIVYRDAVSLSEQQFNVLRSLKNEQGTRLSDNFRPIQPLHNRKVWQHREVEPHGADRPTARPIRPDDKSTSTQSKTILTDHFEGRIKKVAPHGFSSYKEFQVFRDEFLDELSDFEPQVNHAVDPAVDHGVHAHDSRFQYVQPYRGPVNYDPNEGGYGR